MDWQSGVAAGVALVGGGWALWSWVRPFVQTGKDGCGPCGGCGEVSRPPNQKTPLVQIQTSQLERPS